MVEANPAAPQMAPQNGAELDIDDMDDDQFEALCRQMPKLSPEEQEKEMEEWKNHPLNCKELTPDMWERPEYQALMQMGHEGTPMEVQNNFKNHAIEHLGKLLLKTSKNQEKDFQEALHCFEQAIDQ